MEFGEYEHEVKALLESKEAVGVIDRKKVLDKALADKIKELSDDVEKYQTLKENAFRAYKDGLMERDQKTQTIIESDNAVTMLQKERMRFIDLKIRMNATFSL
jgi:hypothetical protein